MPTEQQGPTQKDARAIVLTAMTMAGALSDETMPPEKLEIFSSKPFREWPKEMQDQLRPFGAAMIQ